MRVTLRGVVLLGLLAGSGIVSESQAQDVELWGKYHGTRPPQAYYDLLERDSEAFQFRRAWFRRGLGLRDLPDIRATGRSVSAAYEQAVAYRSAQGSDRVAVSGTFHFPLILGLFSNSPPVPNFVDVEDVQAEFFDGPQANPQAVGTIPDYYGEISGGRVVLTGTTFDWQETSLTRFEVTAGVSGLGSSSRVGEFIVLILESLDDGAVDWGTFDNDGPDGVPNSGDDDGYVDVLAVMHPTPGGECASSDRPNRIWSHRWNLYWNAWSYGSLWDPSRRNAILQNNGYVTRTPSANDTVPNIKILDYTIQPVVTCGGDDINYIGVFAHELGHGFGLPDLYVTNSGDHEGIGNWGLMGTGSWGCDGSSPWRPCHMSAWSKEVLGWADVQTLEPDQDLGTLSLPPVETTGSIFRIDSGDGSRDYLLLENRQWMGFDQNLFEPGLLIWHIDPETIESPSGGINNDPDRMGVWLRQADGLNELGTPDGGRGDAGDPFPGASGNTEFHAGSDPSSWSHEGRAMGATLLNIGQAGDNMAFRALTRYQTLSLRTEGAPSGAGLVSVDESTSGLSEWTVASAPFQHHIIEAAPGEVVEEGIRVGFQGWADGGPRIRDHVTGLDDASFTALYEGIEYFLDVTPVSAAQGIVPGYIDFDGGDGTGWVPDGEVVMVSATPRTGFDFLEWVGAFQGQPNPVSTTVTEPLSADAVFQVTFSVQDNPTEVDLFGGMAHVLTLAVENANQPVYWSLLSGTFPQGLTLTSSGAIAGKPLEGGEFPVTLRVIDGIGLQALLSLSLVVNDPQLPVETLASAFLLSGPPLETSIRAYLDREGNGNNAYDLGDFRAYVLRNPDLASYAETREVIELLIPAADLTRTGGVEDGSKRGRREEGP